VKSEIANQPSSGGGFQPVWQKKIGHVPLRLKPALGGLPCDPDHISELKNTFFALIQF